MSLEAAREELRALVSGWPHVHQRVAVEGDTGLGKTTLAIDRCADHVVGPPLLDGAILFVVHDRARVETIVEQFRAHVLKRHGEPSLVADLLGRQKTREGSGRFGCVNHEVADVYGRRGHEVEKEVCRTCYAVTGCRVDGYLGHTDDARAARVIVTTVAKLKGLSKEVWSAVGGVICDEDVMRGLLGEGKVHAARLRRILHHIDGLRGTRSHSRHGLAMRAVRPLVEAMLGVLAGRDVGFSAALVDLLPEECDRFATTDGLKDLWNAMPTSVHRIQNGEWVQRADPRAPARWELPRGDVVPLQVWGRLLEAFMADIAAGGGAACTTIRVERPTGSRQRANLVFKRLDDRSIQELRERPLLVLDATLHLGVGPVLNVERREIRYDQGRTIVQVMGPLLRLCDLRAQTDAGSVLTSAGRRVVAQLAGWFSGRRGYVLVRKDLVPLVRTEALRYHELRGIEFTSPGTERGWNADPEAIVFAGLGRYAKSTSACEHEAHALRSFMRGLTGSTELLDAFALPTGALIYKGRGAPVRYHGELVERVTRGPKDRLAAAIQEADRVATVRQFIGRNRTGTSEVLLLRGDPTIGADVLVREKDLPMATPRPDAGPGGKHRAPQTGNDLEALGTQHLPPVSGLTASSERSGCLATIERVCAHATSECSMAQPRMTMTKPKKSPAPKPTKATPKKAKAAPKAAAPKDAAAPQATPLTTPSAAKPRDLRLPAVGTSAVREYKGRGVKIKYLADGVEVDGKHFDSLSAAARHVTGAASINGFLWAGLIKSGRPAAKAAKPADAPIGNGNALGTPEGQRAALAAAGLAKRGRPVGKTTGKPSDDPTPSTAPSKPVKGTPEQVTSAAKARAARAAKKATRAAR